MDIPSTIPYVDGHELTCDYCGAKMELTYQKQTGHNEREEFFCPQCHKEFHVRASLPPNVKLLAPRTDGRNDRYPNNSKQD